MGESGCSVLDIDDEEEEESTETSSEYASSDTVTVGGKTSYAAFINRLDDVSDC